MNVIAYIHSPICENIVANLEIDGRIKVVGVICGRGYLSNYGNALHLRKDGFSDALGMISHAYFFDKYLNEFDQDISLVLPHAALGMFKLFAAHKRIKKVYFIEEGDAAYRDDFQLATEKFSCNFIFGENVAGVLEEINYDTKMINFHSECFYSDLFGKYAGVMSCNAMAFRNFPGEKIITRLDTKNVLDKKTYLILISNINDQHGYLVEHLKKSGINVDEGKAFHSMFKSIIFHLQLILSRIDVIPEGGILIKRHPALNSDVFDQITKIFPELKIWEDNYFPVNVRGLEPGFMNFSGFYSLGISSCIRYASMVKKEGCIIHEVPDSQLIVTAHQIYEGAAKDISKISSS